MTVAMNIVTVLILVIAGEGTIRALYKETPTGDVLVGTYLYPREWGKVSTTEKRFAIISGRCLSLYTTTSWDGPPPQVDAGTMATTPAIVALRG